MLKVIQKAKCPFPLLFIPSSKFSIVKQKTINLNLFKPHQKNQDWLKQREYHLDEKSNVSVFLLGFSDSHKNQ